MHHALHHEPHTFQQWLAYTLAWVITALLHKRITIFFQELSYGIASLAEQHHANERTNNGTSQGLGRKSFSTGAVTLVYGYLSGYNEPQIDLAYTYDIPKITSLTLLFAPFQSQCSQKLKPPPNDKVSKFKNQGRTSILACSKIIIITSRTRTVTMGVKFNMYSFRAADFGNSISSLLIHSYFSDRLFENVIAILSFPNLPIRISTFQEIATPLHRNHKRRMQK